MIELLPLKLEHCEQVSDIAKESLPEYWPLETIQDTLRYAHNIYYVARDRGQNKVIGFAGIMVIADEAELLNIAVTQQFRKQGVGQLLLDKVLEEARLHQCYRLLLEVRQSNVTAYNFYQKNEFLRMGERKNYYSNPTEDAIIMERVL